MDTGTEGNEVPKVKTEGHKVPNGGKEGHKVQKRERFIRVKIDIDTYVFLKVKFRINLMLVHSPLKSSTEEGYPRVIQLAITKQIVVHL